MADKRPYPSYYMYRDERREWRWRYDSAPVGEPIAVSSESYKRRIDCRNGIRLMKESANSPVWLPTGDADAD